MQFCTYGYGLIIYRVSSSLLDIQNLLNSNNGDTSKVERILMDIHKMKRIGLEHYHWNSHPRFFFHRLDEQLKIIFRKKGRRYNFNYREINDTLTLFPLIEFTPLEQTLPKGVFRVDYIQGPLVIQNGTLLSDIKGLRWLNNPFDQDLIQFNPNKVLLREDNQIIHREFVINDTEGIQRT
jgi:hypothetical protein